MFYITNNICENNFVAKKYDRVPNTRQQNVIDASQLDIDL